MNRMQFAVVLAAATGWLAIGTLQAAGERETDHAALRNLMKTVTTAINAQDVKTLEASFATPFVLTSVDQTVLTNMAGIAAYYDRMFHAADAPLAAMKIEPQADVLTRFVGPDAGYCYGSSVDTYTLKNGRIFKFSTRWPAVVIKEDGQWKAEIQVEKMDNLINQQVDCIVLQAVDGHGGSAFAIAESSLGCYGCWQ